MIINLAITAITLIVGVTQQWPGLPTAAMALNLASIGEVSYLLWRTQNTLPTGYTLFGAAKAQPANS
jgi:hypothetical protein